MSNPEILVVRSKPHGFDREKEFLNGVISIGWPVGLSFAGASREEIASMLEAHGKYTELEVSQIFNFVHLPPGSIILTPSTSTREVHVFAETKAYSYRPEMDIDPGQNQKWGNPHVIEAKHVRSVSREIFPENVQRALKAARKTVTRFTKYADDIREALARAAQGQATAPPLPEAELKREIVDALRGLLRSPNEDTKLRAALALKELI